MSKFKVQYRYVTQGIGYIDAKTKEEAQEKFEVTDPNNSEVVMELQLVKVIKYKA